MKSIILCLAFCWIGANSPAQTTGTIQENKMKAGHGQRTWQKLSVAGFEELLSDTTIVLIDVRTPVEYSGGHIPGAKNIDVKNENFDREIAKLDPNRPVAVYCRTGVRSTVAAGKLTHKGFKVFELDKGILSWTGKKEK